MEARKQFPSTTDIHKDDRSAHSSQTDLSDVGLCSLNIHEYTFNQFVCLLGLRRNSEALEKLDFLLDTVPKKYADQLWLLRAQLTKDVSGR